jgi:hypothetical protein
MVTVPFIEPIVNPKGGVSREAFTSVKVIAVACGANPAAT